jgi:hypothetical protein
VDDAVHALHQRFDVREVGQLGLDEFFIGGEVGWRDDVAEPENIL